MNFNIPRHYRHFQRYSEIAQILLKNGLGFIISQLDLEKYLPFRKRISKEERPSGKMLAVRTREVLQELGPAYIKLGQLLSTRADILPPIFIKELQKLQDRVPAEPFELIEEFLKKELGDKYDSNITEIDEEPTAAASIAQTHRLILKDGSRAIMKVKRPNIEKNIHIDIEIMENLAEIAQERDLFTGFIRPVEIISEFKRAIRDELNFKSEMANIFRFTSDFKDNPNIKAPEVYSELSTANVLVMEEIIGEKLGNIDSDHPNNKFLAVLGAKALMRQVLINGFFHADPHPGNIFVVDDKVLAYVDFGMVGRITEEDKDMLALLFYALINKKINVLTDIILILGEAPDDLNRRRFKLDMTKLLDRYYGSDLTDIEFQVVFEDVQHFIFEHKIRMPQEFFLLFRAIGVSEGVGLNLDPDFNVVDVGREFIEEILKDRFNPKNIKKRINSGLWKFGKKNYETKTQLKELLEKLVQDDFTINFKHSNLENFIYKLDVVTNRLSVSLIISALIIGSTMLIQTNMDPKIFNIPLFGFIGYIMAGVLGFWLVISIFKSGKY
ncbi:MULTISPECIES: AarF/ABC1/UbiB kinase family protein [unclassified Halanaerobium]|uniref:ABC1 kinase family protein n=1 Tax=unclassified Halanaerobium TaxID=2641197 RepID=UPI000DF10FC0|nr:MULTISPECIES: AarF/ABC1/UbiB kinase family protein [unclassified Halanaerobium]RCW43785.1 2-octaprenylphenol hydroxylase [Halanaerobium sp. MA284_MarDTE_T2]RCW80209.1 2-octaprenylphenol hydroxylase [Halanaerobium sp. DL-01]